MKTTQNTIACAVALAFLAILSSCGLSPIGGVEGAGGEGTVTIVIPVFNPKIFGSRAVSTEARDGASRAYIIASSADIEIWDPTGEGESFGTYLFEPSIPGIIDGGSTENQLTLTTNIVLSAGNYLAKVWVYNDKNDDPDTTEIDEGAIPVVYGQQAFTVGYMLSSVVTVSCAPVSPTILGSGDTSAEIDLPNALVFADDGPPTIMGSETWFMINPTSGCTMISAANVNVGTTTPVPVIALFESTGKLIRTAMPTGPGPTTLSFLSDNTKDYYLAAISGAKVSDILPPRADRHFVISYAPRDPTANNAPAAVSIYNNPSNEAVVWENDDFGLSWEAIADPDGDPVTYRADISTTSDGDAWQYFEPGVFWSRTTDGGGSPMVNVGTLAAGTYYWCVTALDGIGGVSHGPVWSFTIQAPNNAPYQPTDLAPSGMLDTGTLTPTFTWNSNGGDPDGDSVTYRIQMSSSPSFDVDPVYRDVVDVSAYTLDTGLSYSTLYYWIV
ncbi:MAG: hypothetical protein Q8M76_16475, partial [Spirochaetaceae bacterium]|nr:hypothetical protein [Spirochaetaceae bacterium]